MLSLLLSSPTPLNLCAGSPESQDLLLTLRDGAGIGVRTGCPDGAVRLSVERSSCAACGLLLLLLDSEEGSDSEWMLNLQGADFRNLLYSSRSRSLNCCRELFEPAAAAGRTGRRLVVCVGRPGSHEEMAPPTCPCSGLEMDDDVRLESA